MTASPLILPLLAMVALTAAVWVAMVVQRLSAQKRLRLPIDAFATRASTSTAFGPTEKAANHFMNLFEAPVLFYTLVTLAWVYVGLLAVHAVIHCGYNNVTHRAAAFLVSTLVLWVMWAHFGLRLLHPA